MFDSRFSTVKSVAYSDFSSIQASSAPGFVPIPCPSHTEYAITNICKSPSCLQPLCPQCISDHVKLHEQAKTSPKIENIVSVRIKVIQQLAQLKYESTSQLQQFRTQINGNIDQFLESSQRKIETAKRKIQNIIDQYFGQCFKKLEVMSNGYYMQTEKRKRQAKVRLSPLQQYCQRVNNYKIQLQSDDYIPALLQLLNEPPKKPKIDKISPFQSCGSIDVQQSYFQDLKNAISRAINITVNVKSQNSMTILNRSNYHSSNNMKFSRMESSLSIDSSVGLEKRKSSTSKRKIFEKQSQSKMIDSQVSGYRAESKPTKIMKAIFVHKQKGDLNKCRIVNYFKNQKRALITYFQPHAKHYFRANLQYVQSGFEKIPLQIDFLIPAQHRCIVTPKSQIFVLGGQKVCENIEKSIQTNQCFKISQSNWSKLDKLTPMKYPRMSFGCCFNNDSIYVFGGISSKQNTNHSSYNNKITRQLLNTCQRYDIQANTWRDIPSLKQPCHGFQVSSVNGLIIKFGGMTANGSLINRIDIFNTALQSWTFLDTEPTLNFLKFPYKLGSIQLNDENLFLFGGMDPLTNEKSSKCYLLTINQDDKRIQVRQSSDLYSQGTFNYSCIYGGGVMAIQDGDHQSRKKIIMNFKKNQWKFIGC